MSNVSCYNKGCGKKFHEEKNDEESCQFHPGAPIFHEGYKGWSCCKKRSTDFTEFLNIAGCTRGMHNPTKPESPKKYTEEPLKIGEVIGVEHPVQEMKFALPEENNERPRDDIPKIDIKKLVSPSLTVQLKKHHDRLASQINDSKEQKDKTAIKPGTACKHNTCEAKYIDEASNDLECTYHPGAAIFHEGYKFWSCCRKRTSDFNQFLQQLGCESGKHDWMKPSELAEKQSRCRYDWHQTASNVLVSIYAKVCDPEKCKVEANSTGMHAVIAFNGGSNIFELDLKLHGVIDPESSSVEYLGTKVEIKLRKLQSFSWSKLEFVQS